MQGINDRHCPFPGCQTSLGLSSGSALPAHLIAVNDSCGLRILQVLRPASWPFDMPNQLATIPPRGGTGAGKKIIRIPGHDISQKHDNESLIRIGIPVFPEIICRRGNGNSLVLPELHHITCRP